jgi:hypothetical protein
VIAITLVCLVGVGAVAVLAVAQNDDGNSQHPVSADPDVQDYLSHLPPADLKAREAIASGQTPPAGPETNHISDTPVPQDILDLCDQEERSSGHVSYQCQVERAKASGKLPPGDYTDEEMAELIGPPGDQ